jgi:gluconolactonase
MSAGAGHRPAADAFYDLVPRDAHLERLATGARWTEGPVYLPDGDCLLFSDIPNDRVLRWSERDGLSVVKAPSGYANGHTRDLQGRVLRCEQAGRRVVRVEPDGSVVALVERYGGGRLNSPNDIVVKSDGTVWFTDPPYGLSMNWPGHDGVGDLGDTYVFRYDPVSGEPTAVTDALEDPNGLAFSPDESVLYVSDTSVSSREGGNHHIMAFSVVDGRRLEDGRVFAVIEPGLSDGFRVDVAGNVFTSATDGVHVIAPDGTLLGVIDVPERVSNCTFGGPDGRRLFITASTSLYAIDVTTAGAVT